MHGSGIFSRRRKSKDVPVCVCTVVRKRYFVYAAGDGTGITVPVNFVSFAEDFRYIPNLGNVIMNVFCIFSKQYLLQEVVIEHNRFLVTGRYHMKTKIIINVKVHFTVGI